MPAIDGGDPLIRNMVSLVHGCHRLGVPIVVTEQNPRGLGNTVEAVREALESTTGFRPIEKTCFSAAGSDRFLDVVNVAQRKHLLVAGVEAHVCVYQTAMDLMSKGHEVSIIADAVSSRTPLNRSIALQRLTAEGAHITSTEMCLFELVEGSGTDEFRAILRLVK